MKGTQAIALAVGFVALAVGTVYVLDSHPPKHRLQQEEVVEPDEACRNVMVIDKVDVSNPGTSDRHTWLLVHRPGGRVTYICNRNGDYGRAFLRSGMTVKLAGWSAE